MRQAYILIGAREFTARLEVRSTPSGYAGRLCFGPRDLDQPVKCDAPDLEAAWRKALTYCRRYHGAR